MCVGQASYDGGKLHRAKVIAETREDRMAVMRSTFAAGVFVGLMFAAIVGYVK